jgi:hypothetical protein
MDHESQHLRDSWQLIIGARSQVVISRMFRIDSYRSPTLLTAHLSDAEEGRSNLKRDHEALILIAQKEALGMKNDRDH